MYLQEKELVSDGPTEFEDYLIGVEDAINKILISSNPIQYKAGVIYSVDKSSIGIEKMSMKIQKVKKTHFLIYSTLLAGKEGLSW